MAYKRNLQKEAEWEKNVYKRFVYKCRTDNGDLERLEKILDGRSFGEWVREKVAEEIKQNK